MSHGQTVLDSRLPVGFHDHESGLLAFSRQAGRGYNQLLLSREILQSDLMSEFLERCQIGAEALLPRYRVVHWHDDPRLDLANHADRLGWPDRLAAADWNEQHIDIADLIELVRRQLMP